jgi:hypothetical protein
MWFRTMLSRLARSLAHLGPRGLAVLMLAAGGSLGLFAGRALWADKPGVTPGVYGALEGKVSAYTQAYGLDAGATDRVRQALTEYDQQVWQLYREYRSTTGKMAFENLRTTYNARLRDILAPFQRADGQPAGK